MLLNYKILFIRTKWPKPIQHDVTPAHKAKPIKPWFAKDGVEENKCPVYRDLTSTQLNTFGMNSNTEPTLFKELIFSTHVSN